MAQIVTITNPLTGQPAQVDQLEHTAQEIDDAIARALPGGGIDTLLSGKAPAGYGLGGVATWLGSTDDLNNIKKTGWYRWFGRPINAPGDFGAMTVVVTAPDGRLVQEVVFVLPKFDGTSNYHVNCKVRRICYQDTWQPWEWENPPMMLGVEYRTTERHLGKPVYVKLVDVGTLKDGSSSAVTVYKYGVAPDATGIVDYRFLYSYNPGTVTFNNMDDIISDSGAIWAHGSVSNYPAGSGTYDGAYIAIRCLADMSNYSAKCTFKYIKE